MNNVVKFEFRLKYKMLFTISGILFTIFLLYIGLYPSFATSIASFTKMVDTMPKALLEMLNFDLVSFTSFSGYYVFILSIINVIFAVFGAKLAFSTFSQEKAQRIEEYLFVKPITKQKIYISKTIASLYCYLFLSAMLYIISTTLAIIIVDNVSYTDILVLNLSPILVSIWIYSFTTIFAVIIKKVKFQTPYIASIVILFFMLSFVVETKLDKLFSFLTPFSLYSPSIMLQDGISIGMFIYTILVIIIFNIIANYFYISKEVR